MTFELYSQAPPCYDRPKEKRRGEGLERRDERLRKIVSAKSGGLSLNDKLFHLPSRITFLYD